MIAFIGMQIQMGVRKIPEINDIWSIDEAERDPFFSNRRTCDRYCALSTYFHAADNSQAVQNWRNPNFDPLSKIKPMIDHADIRFAAFYQRKQHIIAYGIFLLEEELISHLFQQPPINHFHPSGSHQSLDAILLVLTAISHLMSIYFQVTANSRLLPFYFQVTATRHHAAPSYSMLTGCLCFKDSNKWIGKPANIKFWKMLITL